MQLVGDGMRQPNMHIIKRWRQNKSTRCITCSCRSSTKSGWVGLSSHKRFSQECIQRRKNSKDRGRAIVEPSHYNQEPVYDWNLATDQMELHPPNTQMVGFLVISQTQDHLSFYNPRTGRKQWVRANREGIDWRYTRRPWSNNQNKAFYSRHKHKQTNSFLHLMIVPRTHNTTATRKKTDTCR